MSEEKTQKLVEAMKQAEAQMRLKGKTSADTIELKTLSDALDEWERSK